MTKKHTILIPFLLFCLLSFVLLYYFIPTNSLLILTFSGLLAWITAEDYRDQNIDMRLLGVLALLSVFLSGSPAIRIMLLLTGVLALSILFLSFVSFVEPGKEQEGECIPLSPDARQEAYDTTHGAVGFVPIFTGSLFLVLATDMLYGMMLPPELVDVSNALIDLQTAIGRLTLPMCLIVLSVLAGITWLLYLRIQKKRREGKTVLYRSIGRGDVFFLPVMLAAFGLPVFLASFSLAIYAAIGMLLWLRFRHRKNGKNARSCNEDKNLPPKSAVQ